MMTEKIKTIITESIATKQLILTDDHLVKMINTASNICIDAFSSDKKVLFCGNGGSAADAQHLAAEFSGRFYKDRDPLFSEALHVNSSFLTAVANDYDFSKIYSRLIKAKGKEGDVLVGISTSGNSPNIVEAFRQAKIQGMTTIGMTGQTGGQLADLSDILINIPSTDTPRIQECHILAGHIICEIVEDNLF